MSAQTPAPLATLYLRHEGIVYRFQVFERGTAGQNDILSLSQDTAHPYDPTTGIWDNAALQRLIVQHAPQHEIDIEGAEHERAQWQSA
jgi:hypothetical protein